MSDTLEIQVRRVLHELDQNIVEVNSAHIENSVGKVSKADFVHLADTIAELRAQYLKTVMETARASTAELDEACRQTLARQREVYREALEGYMELKHALERGYFRLAD
ncbi:MAG: hypothetical protein ACPG4N_06905 [Gammaproteobacteria bacterium]